MNEKKKKSSSKIDSNSLSGLKNRFQIAEGYSKAGLLLTKYAGRTQDSSVLHSLMALKGLAVEAYLKCLYDLDHQKSYTGDDLQKLFEALGKDSQELIETYFEELKENYHIVCGTPDTVLEKLKHIHGRLGMEHLIMYGQESKMDHEATMANIGLFGKEVLPVIRDW